MKQAVILDPIDRRIVAELQRDATLTNGALAERVGSSGASCWRRVKALEAEGVLRQAVRLVDAERVGLGVNVLCNIRVRSHAVDVRGPFEAFVDARPEILECYSMSGEWDYLLRIVAASVSGYEAFLMRVLLEHPAVAHASSHFALSLTKHITALPV